MQHGYGQTGIGAKRCVFFDFDSEPLDTSGALVRSEDIEGAFPARPCLGPEDGQSQSLTDPLNGPRRTVHIS